MSYCSVCHNPVKSGLVVHSECLPGLSRQLNDKPLDLEALRRMAGEPVYIERIGGNIPNDGAWALVNTDATGCKTADGGRVSFDNYGKTWLAYCFKPNRWSRIEDGLPPDPPGNRMEDLELPEYIVWVKGATQSTVMYYAGDGEWVFDGDRYAVTHWMPMPALPKDA